MKIDLSRGTKAIKVFFSSQKLSKTAVNFTCSSLFRTFSGMAVSAVAISFVGPEKLGLWHAALLIQPYLSFLQLGLTQGVGRELPILMGRNEHKRVQRYAATAQSVTAFYTSISLITSLILAFFLAEGIESKLIFTTGGVFISTIFIDNYLSCTYRSSNSFRDLSKAYYISSVLSILLLPLIVYFGFKGYLVLLLVTRLLTTLLLIVLRPIKVPFSFEKEVYFETIKTGFPMLVLNFFRTIPDTYPRLLILFLLSTAALGLTAPANAAYMAFAVVPVTLARYVYPKMTFNFGKTADRYKLWKTSKKLILILSCFGIFGLLSLFLVPFAMERYFPQYVEATFITMVAVIIGFLRMFSILYNVFNTLKSYRVQTIIGLVRNVVYIVFPLLFFYLSSFDKLNGIFLGILCGEMITTIVTFYYLYKVTHLKGKPALNSVK